MAVEPQRVSGGTFDFVMVFFFKCGPGHAKEAGGKTLSGTGTVLESCWIRGGTVVELRWIRSGTMVEPLTILVEPGLSDGLVLCVFEHSACSGPRPTRSLYNTKRKLYPCTSSKGARLATTRPPWSRKAKVYHKAVPKFYATWF